MALDRWQQQLCKLLEAVHKKQQQYDQAISACQLLLKPWPKKSNASESGAKKDVPESGSNAADAQVSPREEAELRVVNDLLQKAQKTRVKTSQKLKEHVCPVDDGLPSFRSGSNELLEINESETQTIQDLAPKRDMELADSKPVPAIKMNNSLRKNVGVAQTEQSTKKNAVKKQQQKIQPARERGNQSSSSVSERQSTASRVRKPTPTNDQRRSESLESKERPRPSSRPTSGRGRFQPAHATAPFKTDPNLNASKRSVKSSVRVVKQHPAGKRQNYAGDRNYGTKVLPPISSSGKDTAPAVVSTAQGDSVVQDVCDTHSSVPNGESSVPEGTLNSKLCSITLDNDSVQDVSSQPSDAGRKAPHSGDSISKPEEKQEVKCFSLLTDGSSINIPPKVRRAFAKNQQLRKKMSQRDTGRKAKSGDSDLGLKFMEQLQELFEPEEELLYRQQALECLHTHQQLLQLLTHLNLDNVTDVSSAEDILRAKTLSEFILSSFSELSEEANVLSKVQFSDTPGVVEPCFNHAGHPYLWLPASLQGQNLCSADRLLYTSKIDLNRYMNEMLRLQTLQCQRHLLDILVSDVLPWLQQEDCGQEDYGTFFRGLFASLTSDGTHRPVLIRDPVP